MRAISLLSLTIAPSGLLWYGASDFTATSSEAVEPNSTAPNIAAALSNRDRAARSQPPAKALLSTQEPQPTFSVTPTVTRLPATSLGTTPSVAGSTVSSAQPSAYSSDSQDTALQNNEIAGLTSLLELDLEQVRSVVNRTVGDRSPALASIAARPNVSPFILGATPLKVPLAPAAATALLAMPTASLESAVTPNRGSSQLATESAAEDSSQTTTQTAATQTTVPSTAQQVNIASDDAGRRALAMAIANQGDSPTPNQQLHQAAPRSTSHSMTSSTVSPTVNSVASSLIESLRATPAAQLVAQTADVVPNNGASSVAQTTNTQPAVSPSLENGVEPILPPLSDWVLPISPDSIVVPDTATPNQNVVPNPGPLLPGTFNSAIYNTGVDENYILGPGDIIEVIFFNVPEYSGQHRISTNGAINLPLVGRVSVKDLTLNQAGDAIAARYLSILQSPIVSINVLQQRPIQVAISGEIIQPGLYTLSAQETAYPRIFQALQQAGGLTQAADLKEVEVRRQGINGSQTTLKVDLLALLQEGDISQNIVLQDGDAVLISSTAEVNRVALNELSVSNLRANNNRPLSIAIVGAVTQPGPYQLGGEGGQVTITQALQNAGGIVPSANLREVQLRRQTRQGDGQVFNINLWDALQTGDLSQDLALQQGDTIVVPTADDISIEEFTALASSTLSTGTIKVNIIGEVESPGSLDVRANTSLNQALLAAGGLNKRARREATLVRFNSNGTVDRQSIDVDLSQDINPESNPLLRPNDVIVVGRSARAAFDDSVSGFSRTFNLVWPFLFLF
ncbi:MAG: SLBB domain-containing protein [Phormidesmis sp.]